MSDHDQQQVYGYSRVIPRDCFNEAKVYSGHIKLVDDYNSGKLPAGFRLSVNNESTDIEQALDGDLMLTDVAASFNGETMAIGVIYNAGKQTRFPLIVTVEDSDVYSVPVYNDQGDLDEEFIEAFGDSQAQPDNKIVLNDLWEKARDFLNQLGRVGLWQVDWELSDKFTMELNEPERGFELEFQDDGTVESNNLVAGINGKPIHFYLGSAGDLRFRCDGLDGGVQNNGKEISPIFASVAGRSSDDTENAPPAPKM